MIQGIPLATILAVIVAAFYIMDFYFMHQYDHQRSDRGKGWAWDYTLLTLALGMAVILQPIALPGIGLSLDAPLGFLLQAAGGLAVITCFVLHVWARQHLRHYYTERVEVQDHHEVIDSGPYALVRHPIILSFFLIAGGIFLINPAFTTLFVLVYAIRGFNNAAQLEEVMLGKNVPGYIEYMKRVPRFIPNPWKSK